MKLLELFAVTRSVGKAFEKRGHKVFSVEWNKDFENIDLYDDILNVISKQITDLFGRPDVIWTSPDCSTFSIAAISRHRIKNPVTGSLDAVSDYAKFCDRVNRHVLQLISELDPKYFFIENPRGGLRKMEYMKGLPRYTVTYCQYGDARMKPTDNHPAPDFRPMCHNCDGCHTAAPRGSKTGTQGLKNSKERAKIPERISELSRNIDELIKLAAGGDTKQSIADIQKFSNEMTALREFIESEKAKQSSAEKDNRQLETVLDMLEKENFQLTEYDDVAVRHLIEYIKVIDKNALLICFKGGFEVRKEI